MHRSMLPVIAAVSVAAIAATTLVNAAAFAAPRQEAAPVPAAVVATVSYSVADVHASFTDTGLTVDAPQHWDWTSPPMTSIKMHDSDGRVLIALIYSDSETARLARTQAEANDRTSRTGSPHLVEGFGPSLWNGNVALVQARESDLNRLYQQTIDRANGLDVDTSQGGEDIAPMHAVDFEFQQALNLHLGSL
jgi:hypothetical protein